MIEIHCQLRCAGCGSLRSTIIQMRVEDALRLSGGSLRFVPREQLTLLDIGDWRLDEHNAIRCRRC